MNKPRVLLVDDEEPIRLAAQYALEEWYEITTVATTAKAFELLENGKYDVMLLDMMIAGEGTESGLRALKIISKEYLELPVIVLTGTISWMQRGEELKQLGVVGYLIKPFERESAKEIIDQCIKNH